MLVWRLCRRRHADLSGEGGRLVSGRWHGARRPVIYTAYEPALAILEVRVHLDLPFESLPDDYVMMGIDLGALAADIPALNPATDSLIDTRAAGDAWLRARQAPVVSVPSILAPRGINYLIDPLHPLVPALTIAVVEAFRFDARLWQTSR